VTYDSVMGLSEGAGRSHTTVSHYRVGERIGRGSMGEVYEAMDLNLDRSVAIKFLPEFVLSNERAVNRFIAEAKSASALNHPNLVTIHEFIREDGVLAIVMERIEGGSLRDAMPRQQTLEAFVRSAHQLAEALAATHERGIIHRDIKPENIMVRADGYVKVLDFGLAELTGAAATNAYRSAQTTAGTLRYMSPEQKQNKSLTPASDVYSLGMVFLEMLSGNPDPDGLRATTRRLPGALRQLLAGMVKENPAERPSAQSVAERVSRIHEPSRRPVLWAAAALVAAAALSLTVWRMAQPVDSGGGNLVPQPLTTFPGDENGVSFSPDGRKVVFSWDGERQDNFDIYEMDVRDRVPKRLTSHAAADLHPAWSPDGKTIAFHRETGGGRAIVYLLPVAGGQERAIGEIILLPSTRRILDWSPDSRWLVLHDAPTAEQEEFALFLISTESGERRRLTNPPRNERHTSPAFSPDGRRIVLVRDFEGVMDLAILGLTPDMQPESPPFTVQIANFNREICSNPRWTPDGKKILFGFNRGGGQSLWQVTAPTSPDEIVTPSVAGAGDGADVPALSANGERLAFTRRLVDLNLWRMALPVKGPAALPTRLISSTRTERFPDISSKGRLAFESDRSGFSEIWVSDIDGANARAVTNFKGPGTGTPRWSPDGSSLAFDSRVHGQPDVFILDIPEGAGGTGTPRRLTEHAAQDNMPAWSPDGKWIFFNSNRSGATHVWKVAATGGEPVSVSPGDARGPLVSRDGRWVYYSRGSRNATEVWRVSSDGGPEALVLKDVVDRSFVPARNGVYFLRRERGTAAMFFFNSINSTEHKVAELDSRIQPGLAVSQDDSFIVLTMTDGGSRDLMLVEGYKSR
jgi:Tol biopolymer transport system component